MNFHRPDGNWAPTSVRGVNQLERFVREPIIAQGAPGSADSPRQVDVA